MGDLYKENLRKCLQEGEQLFLQKYGSEPSIRVSAPGRVNLIGEHTDYNDGFVLPMAMPLMTVVVGRKVHGSQCSITSTAEEKDVKQEAYQAFPVPEHPGEGKEEVPCKEDPLWIKYVKGVIALMNGKGDVPGFEAVITSCVPLGGGLSSSASLEVAVALFVEQLLGRPLPSRKDLALLCQQAEHRYAGNKCGIMDQFISAMAAEGSALLIDCEQEKEYGKQIPMSKAEEEVVWLVTDSGRRHKLAGGENEYNKRRRCCDSAVAHLKVQQSLRYASMEILEAGKGSLSDVEYRRARHVISEIQRTKQAAGVLTNGQYEEFGQLMNQSHDSLRDDYEVSCSELDKLVELARGHPRVLGSRMTGGGFGGCTVTLLYSDALAAVQQTMKEEYAKFTQGAYEVIFYEALASPGATVL